MGIIVDYIKGKAEKPEFKKQVDEVRRLAGEYEEEIMNLDWSCRNGITIAFGGDGTFHKVANKEENKKRWLLFVRPSRNRSSGFMADIDFDNLEKALQKIITSDFTVQAMPRMDVRINDKSVGSFMGDMWICRGPTQNTIEMQVEVEYNYVATKQHYGCKYAMGHFYDIVKSDGILFYLPLASSAYHRTLGGPMVDWDTPMFGLKYMAPCRTISGQTGYQCDYRNRDFRLEFAGWEGEEAVLRLDWMDKGIPIKYGDKVLVKKADEPSCSDVIRVMPEIIYEKQVRHDEMHFERTRNVWKENVILQDRCEW